MRTRIVKTVALALFAVPIAGPLAVVELAHAGAASSASSACPAGMGYHQGGSYTQDKQHQTPIRINGSNDCYGGISVKGTWPTSDAWWTMKQCCNGAGITVDHGPTALVNAYTYNASTDGIRIWNGAAVSLSGVHEVYTRDDCISDITHGDLTINDSLFDGCHTGISWRSGGKKGPFKVNIQNTLFYVQPEPGGSGGGNCKQYVVNGKANGPMWKMDGTQGPVTVSNTVIRQDLGNHECVDKWPSGTYNNVTFVWTGSGSYPGTLPAGVTLTRDVSVWDNAKSAWLARHGGSGGGSGGGTPTPQPSSSPTGNPSPTPSPTPSSSPSGDPSPQPTGTQTGNPVPGQSGGSAGNVPSSCPNNRTSMSNGSNYSSNANNTTFDGSNATYTETTKNITPVVLNGNSNCLVGVTVNSSIDRSLQWWQMKQCCNGAGVTLNGAAYLQDVRIDNAGVDGIRIWNSAPVSMNGVYESYTRDDCISDITHGDLNINDSLFDGCHTGISWRSDNNSNKRKFAINIQNTLFYVQPEPGGSSGGSCKQWVVNGKANGPMWKMDGTQGPVNLKNVIIRQDYGNHECKDVWPSGSYSNVTFVWTSSKAYPGTLPSGVTMTRNVSVWNNAKSAWLSRHGY